ncbi:MAG: hypothetical protein LBO78_03195, partial [Rickettsiales bacterium]|nr:hypothetical protein [Rickettsiales bacterium]
SEQAVATAAVPTKSAAAEKKTAVLEPAAKAARPKPKETARAAAPKRGDRFSGVKVGEGEEVLVSVYHAPTSAFVLPEPLKNAEDAKPLRPVLPAPMAEEIPGAASAVETSRAEPAPRAAKKSDDSPFGISVSSLMPDELNIREMPAEQFVEVSEAKPAPRPYVTISQAKPSPFMKTFSAISPEGKKKKKKAEPPREAPAAESAKSEKQVSGLSPDMLKNELYRTYISENDYLSPVEYVGNSGDDAAEPAPEADAAAALDVKDVATRVSAAKKSILLPGGSLKVGGREVLQMKLDFEPSSAAVTGESVNVIRSFAQIASDQPTNSIEIGLPESVMRDPKKKRLTARRLAIISNILRSSGLADKQIYPILTTRDEDSFSFRVIGNDAFDTIRVAKTYDPFGDEENVQEYNLMRW